MSDYLGQLEHVVLLAVMRLEGDGYGVSIRDEIERRTGRRISPGTIYPMLDRLDHKGFVASRTDEPRPERGGRSRRLVRVTPEGLDALRASRRALLDLERGYEGVLSEPEAT